MVLLNSAWELQDQTRGLAHAWHGLHPWHYPFGPVQSRFTLFLCSSNKQNSTIYLLSDLSPQTPILSTLFFGELSLGYLIGTSYLTQAKTTSPSDGFTLSISGTQEITAPSCRMFSLKSWNHPWLLGLTHSPSKWLASPQVLADTTSADWHIASHSATANWDPTPLSLPSTPGKAAEWVSLL